MTGRDLAFLLLLAVPLGAPLQAHGGQYRAPGDANPSAGSGSGSTGGTSPSGPSAPSAGSGSGSSGSSGSSGTSNQPGGGAGAGGAVRSGPAGTIIGEDQTRWLYWWENRKDPYLGLRQRVYDTGVVQRSDEYFLGGRGDREMTLRPSRNQILGQILPVLHHTLETVDQRDITSSCLVALAKIGMDAPHLELIPALRLRLTSHDQEIRETAALAMGISQRTAVLPDLISLLADDARGRKLVDGSRVDIRTRSFAAYGIGLVAGPSDSAAIKRIAMDALAAVAKDRELVGFDLPVAAITALGMLQPENAGDRGGEVLNAALAHLGDLWAEDRGAGHQLVQSHVPPSVAALLQPSDAADQREKWARTFAVELQKAIEQRESQRSPVLAESAALALGRLSMPHEKGAADAWISELLFETAGKARDQQTCWFSLTALGEIGGELNRDLLLKVLREGKKSLERPWAALALGVLEHRRMQRVGAGAQPDPAVAEGLRAALTDVRNPEALGAFAVAGGLAGTREIAPELRELLADHRAQDEFAGYLCIGLGLMDDRGSLDVIREIVRTSARRPVLQLQSAVALGRLGDKTAAVLLVDELSRSGNNLAVSGSLAFAIGQIGDRRSVNTLVELIEDEARPAISRAFAVVALGGVADKDPLPWVTRIGRQVNYRASVPTLTNQASGVLDIL